MAKKERYPEAKNRPLIGDIRELEGSGSSGHADPETTVCENSSIPHKKLVSSTVDNLRIPTQILHLSKLSVLEKKNLLFRLRAELEQIRGFQKQVDSCKAQGQPAMLTPRTEKQKPPSLKGRAWNQGYSAKLESVKLESANAKQELVPSTSLVMVMKQCETLLKRLMTHQFSSIFNEPVDILKLNIPDYYNIIKCPMDLGTVKKKLSSGAYMSPLHFLADVRLVFLNAMTYNPPGNDVHTMAQTLSQFFELRWKPIEKKLPPIHTEEIPNKSGPHQQVKSPCVVALPKKRILSSMQQMVLPKPVLKMMTAEEKSKLSKDLESLMDMPNNIIEFLKEHCSSGAVTTEDEIEIDLGALSDDTLFRLRKLLDKHLQERQKAQDKLAEPCEIELLHGSGLSNSSMQACKGNEHMDADVDIEGSEPPVSTYCSIDVDKSLGKRRESFESESNEVKASLHTLKVDSDALDKTTSTTQPEENIRENIPCDVQISSEKLYRTALLKSRFADTILNAREKNLNQDDKSDPQKHRLEREERERQQREEKARLQAEARSAEEAQRKAAAAEAKRKRELERAAARETLLQMERTVEVNENSHILNDLEMLRVGPGEHLSSYVDETQESLCGFIFGGSKALEKLGLFMKEDEEEEADFPSIVNQVNDAEEGEID